MANANRARALAGSFQKRAVSAARAPDEVRASTLGKGGRRNGVSSTGPLATGCRPLEAPPLAQPDAHVSALGESLAQLTWRGAATRCPCSASRVSGILPDS